jgi:small-conductance mechanosensitive channel
MTRVAQADDLAAAASDLSKMASVMRWSGVLASAFVVALAAIILRGLSSVLRRLSDRYTDRRLTLQQVASIARFLVYIVTASVVVALSVRVDETVLTLLGGTLAVAIGFAMRDLVASVIAGVIIMLDRPFQVGDRVEYAGAYGDILAIGLRSVRMYTLDENTVTIPNNKILTDITSSANYGALDMQVNIDLYLGVEEDFVLAERLLREAMLTSNFVYLAQPVLVGIAERLDKGRVLLQLRGKASVFDTAYEKAFVSEVTRRALLAFKEHRINVG